MEGRGRGGPSPLGTNSWPQEGGRGHGGERARRAPPASDGGRAGGGRNSRSRSRDRGGGRSRSRGEGRERQDYEDRRGAGGGRGWGARSDGGYGGGAGRRGHRFDTPSDQDYGEGRLRGGGGGWDGESGQGEHRGRAAQSKSRSRSHLRSRSRDRSGGGGGGGGRSRSRSLGERREYDGRPDRGGGDRGGGGFGPPYGGYDRGGGGGSGGVQTWCRGGSGYDQAYGRNSGDSGVRMSDLPKLSLLYPMSPGGGGGGAVSVVARYHEDDDSSRGATEPRAVSTRTPEEGAAAGRTLHLSDISDDDNDSSHGTALQSSSTSVSPTMRNAASVGSQVTGQEGDEKSRTRFYRIQRWLYEVATDYLSQVLCKVWHSMTGQLWSRNSGQQLLDMLNNYSAAFPHKIVEALKTREIHMFDVTALRSILFCRELSPDLGNYRDLFPSRDFPARVRGAVKEIAELRNRWTHEWSRRGTLTEDQYGEWWHKVCDQLKLLAEFTGGDALKRLDSYKKEILSESINQAKALSFVEQDSAQLKQIDGRVASMDGRVASMEEEIQDMRKKLEQQQPKSILEKLEAGEKVLVPSHTTKNKCYTLHGSKETGKYFCSCIVHEIQHADYKTCRHLCDIRGKDTETMRVKHEGIKRMETAENWLLQEQVNPQPQAASSAASSSAVGGVPPAAVTHGAGSERQDATQEQANPPGVAGAAAGVPSAARSSPEMQLSRGQSETAQKSPSAPAAGQGDVAAAGAAGSGNASAAGPSAGLPPPASSNDSSNMKDDSTKKRKLYNQKQKDALKKYLQDLKQTPGTEVCKRIASEISRLDGGRDVTADDVKKWYRNNLSSKALKRSESTTQAAQANPAGAAGAAGGVPSVSCGQSKNVQQPPSAPAAEGVSKVAKPSLSLATIELKKWLRADKKRAEALEKRAEGGPSCDGTGKGTDATMPKNKRGGGAMSAGNPSKRAKKGVIDLTGSDDDTPAKRDARELHRLKTNLADGYYKYNPLPCHKRPDPDKPY